MAKAIVKMCGNAVEKSIVDRINEYYDDDGDVGAPTPLLEFLLLNEKSCNL